MSVTCRPLFLLLLTLAMLLPTGLVRAQEVPQQILFPELAGEALREQLRAAYHPTQTLGYDRARDVLYQHLDATYGALRGVYTGYTIHLDPAADPSTDAYHKGINAEHVFPQSRGAGEEPARSDMHHLFPVKDNVNSARSNTPYAEIPDAETDRWYGATGSLATPPASDRDGYSEDDADHPDPGFTGRFEPREDAKGNAARAVFYFFTVYAPVADSAFFEVQREDLLRWHRDDAADRAEYDRSTFIAGHQGTHNPFVLDSTLARRAFGEPVAPPVETPAPGPLVVTEWMANPDAVADEVGEYVEFYNPGPDVVDLQGLELGDDDGDRHRISASVVVPPGEVAVLAASADPLGDGSFHPTYVYHGVRLANGADEVVLRTSDGAEVARLAYADGDPFGAGTALVLADLDAGGDGVTAPSDYQAAADRLSNGDRGSPGVVEAVRLPVELGRFSGRADGRAAVLTWETASETNNAGFAIEHAPPAGPGFAERAFVPGAGTSATPRRYRHRVDGLASGSHRFRLRQTDYDGAATHSDVVEVAVGHGASTGAAVLSPVYPHPVHTRAVLPVEVRRALPTAELALFDVLGRRVAVLHHGPLGAGRHRFMLDAARLAPGRYTLRLAHGAATVGRRPVVVR